jgi:NAD(P)H-hydrate epimerase
VAVQDWLDPLLDADGMRAVDRWAIDEQKVPSLELMEAAGGALAAAVEELRPQGPVRVVCGKGNNGGDGLVAARLLAETGFDAEVLLLWPADELSEDATANLRRFAGNVRELAEGEAPAALDGSGAVVDAIFGTGFSGAPREPAASAIAAINDCGAPVAAADVASGVDASTGEVEGIAVEAQVTVTFHAAKVGHLVAPGKGHTGELVVAPIGIPEGGPGEPSAGVIRSAALRELPRRGPASTKFSSGQVLVIGGSRGLTGAPCMSAMAATRTGAGYATVAVPAELEAIFEVKLTEVMSVGCPSADGHFTADAAEPIVDSAERAAAVVLGPGIGRTDVVRDVVADVTSRVQAPLVIDADALNALAGRLDLVKAREAPTVLTPHAGELGRLLERDSDEIGKHRVGAVKEAAEASGAIVVLKGDDTLIAAPGELLAVNALSSPALATAGTGDVLSGMIGALIARGVEARSAAAAAVYAHTRAGRFAAARVGAPESVVATDVIEEIPVGLDPDMELP